MKITDIVDNGFVINFAYTVQADYETMHTGVHMLYRVDTTDARKSAVDSIVVDGDTASDYDGKKKMFIFDIRTAAGKSRVCQVIMYL